MAISSSFAAKSAGAISGAIGVPAAAVYAHKYATSLYEVEQKVLDSDIKLEVKGPTSNTITIEALVNSGDTVDNGKLPSGHSWSCVIELIPSETLTGTPNLKENIQSHLYKDGTMLDEQRKNKEKLVKACSKNRKDTPSETTVKGSLVLNKKGSPENSFKFERHSELDFLLTKKS